MVLLPDQESLQLFTAGSKQLITDDSRRLGLLGPTYLLSDSILSGQWRCIKGPAEFVMATSFSAQLWRSTLRVLGVNKPGPARWSSWPWIQRTGEEKERRGRKRGHGEKHAQFHLTLKSKSAETWCFQSFDGEYALLNQLWLPDTSEAARKKQFLDDIKEALKVVRRSTAVVIRHG